MRRILVYSVFFLLLTSIVSCSRSGRASEVHPVLDSLLSHYDAVTPYMSKGVTPPDGGAVRMRSRRLGSFGKIFNDSNHTHMVYARLGGISPMNNEQEAWVNGKGLVRVSSDKYIYVDSLTHSYPYLKPHAAELLAEIGKRFADTLAARGGGAYRLKLTSVLRTPMTVGKLRRVNRNATSESAHQYGTTFDISYSKFICDDSTATRRTFEDLKNLLAEIIYDLRAEGRCLVKHERKQACFHITAAPDSLI